MSAAKHILLRVWRKDKDGKVNGPSKHTVIWELDRWEKHRLQLMKTYGDAVDEMFVIARGGLKRLKLLQQSLLRLDNA